MRPRPHHLLPCLTLCLGGCREASPEAQVRAAFARCVDALEAGDAAAACESLAPDFSGPEGLDKTSARFALLGLLRQERVGLTVLGNAVTVRGKVAEQQVEVLVTRRAPGGVLPQEAERRAYRLRWRSHGGTWQLQTLSAAGGP